MEQLNDFKRIILIKVNELRAIAEELGRILAHRDESLISQVPKCVYGLKGIAELFNCSIPTDKLIKSSVKISGAISQCDRIIITDVKKEIDLFGNKSGGWRQ